MDKIVGSFRSNQVEENFLSSLKLYKTVVKPKKNHVSRCISVNYHVTNICNYRCIFCFARFPMSNKCLQVTDATKIISMLRSEGMEKLTFVGGEPFLYPQLGSLLEYSKTLGLTTAIVTNGSLLDKQFLDRYSDYIDWIGFSIDSASEETEKRLGRCYRKNRIDREGHVNRIKRLVKLTREYDIKIKINSVITSLNWQEDMRDLITGLNPDRWKVFQVLRIKGENDKEVDPLLITSRQFEHFKTLHVRLNPVVESNEDMSGSYLMVSPEGCFFDNITGKITYSQPIIEVGVKNALKQVNFSLNKFIERKGFYNW